MESEYWWVQANMQSLLDGKYFIKNPELEAEIGNLTFSKPEWNGGGLRVKGTKAGAIECFMTPRNCGHMTIGALPAGYVGPEIDQRPAKNPSALADFIARNVAVAGGYSVLTASGEPKAVEAFTKLGTGWKEDFRETAGRSGHVMAFMHLTIPNDQIIKSGYFGINSAAVIALKPTATAVAAKVA